MTLPSSSVGTTTSRGIPLPAVHLYRRLSHPPSDPCGYGSPVPVHPDALILPTLAADTTAHIRRGGAVLESITAGCHPGSLHVSDQSRSVVARPTPCWRLGRGHGARSGMVGRCRSHREAAAAARSVIASARVLGPSSLDIAMGLTARAVMRREIQDALLDRVITINPVIGSKLPKRDGKPQHRTRDGPQIAQFLDATAGTRWHPICQSICGAGGTRTRGRRIMSPLL
jgi:hypothetical protein